MKLYHVTAARNLGKIMREGLVPRIGPRSKRSREKADAIYFFPSLEVAENGLENWMVHEFSEEARLVLLEVTIPAGVAVYSDVEFERHIFDPIDPKFIRVLSRDVFSEVSLVDLG